MRRLGASTLAAGVVFAVLGLAAGPAGADKPEDKGKPDRETFKVTICHRENN